MKWFKGRHIEMAGLYFMFHADPKIGTGHLFRCCKIADFIREKYGIEFSFNFTEKPLPAARRLLEGRRVWSMGTHVEKLPCFGDRPALVVLDDYSIGFEEERLIREGVYRLAVIDDLVRRHTCDVLFDGNILRTPEEYSESAATVGKMCCGPEYSLVGRDFISARRARTPPFRKCLVSFGGSDPQHCLRTFVRTAMSDPRFRKYRFEIVSGPMNGDHSAVLRMLLESDLDWNIRKSTEFMPELMKESDFALGAGGGMFLERVAACLPSVTVSEADNQSCNIMAAREKGLSLVLDESSLSDADALLAAFDGLEANAPLYEKNSRELIDGRGIERVAKALIECAEETLDLVYPQSGGTSPGTPA